MPRDGSKAQAAAPFADIHALAERFFDAIVRRDLETLRGVYCAATRVKLNFLPTEMSGEENLAILDGLSDRFSAIRYTDAHRYAFDGGFAQRHNFTGVRRSDGEAYSVLMCLIALVEDGHIVRIDEYMDTAARQPA